MSKEIIEKLDAIEAKQIEAVSAVEAKIPEAIAAVQAEMAEKFSAFEAKLATVQAPAIIRAPAKTVRSDVNRSVKEQIATYFKNGRAVEKELKMFEDESQYDAYLREASALTGGGNNQGGRTGYDPTFVALRLANPMRGISRTVATDGSSYQFRVKTGNAGAAWGYTIQNNGSTTTEDTSIWQLVLQDLNVQFPIRTAALDDIDGLEANVVDDMLVEFSQSEALSMIQNNDQAAQSGTNPYGGTNGLRGLDQYAGANATYTGGTSSTAAFGSSGTGSTTGLHSLATYDQLTSNANTVGANAIQYKDVINLIYALPQQYWTPNAKFMVNPILAQAIRGLQDTNGRPIFNSVESLNPDGIIGQLLGFDVVMNKYLDNPSQATTGSAGTNSLYPMYFADFSRFHTIVDRLNMVMRRYDQTLPGSITFYGEKRLATSVRDPNAGVRYRSTGTAT
ncbi:COG4653 Predicted phage phi-C31 gp36 major capsid-like protein [uncultured Caudovirales phage]|uniref:COG4653 Predicted phage phi-C31 gp36 major capsid-like protein n=1 Tax=uncultured Caudovirales phage TaxID=2100421 RepID=A0A6J5LI00_9CAUD|nr:COG4653 Predicted phage phi-C31 gp36 major capsid-like protein [uncultured Caudovirales phage]